MLKSCFHHSVIEAGCDESGRGCLAGPVFAAAVILPPEYAHPELNDSKKLNEKLRNKLRKEIESVALDWAVYFIDNKRIDKVNILRASIMAMHQALDRLKLRPDHIIIDGNHFYKYRSVPHQCIIKGDAQYASIAAASVLAKTHRDEYMLELHKNYNYYGWNTNKGYATQEHRMAIERFGISPYHRRSFSLVVKQLNLYA